MDLFRKLCATLFALIACVSSSAETSLSIEAPILAVAVELGTTVSPNDYVSLTAYTGVGDLYGAGATWVRSANDNDSHWFGAGVGNMSDDGKSSIISFDIGTYGSLDYKYFRRGLSSSGFYFYTSVRIQSEGAYPWFGFGFNW